MYAILSFRSIFPIRLYYRRVILSHLPSLFPLTNAQNWVATKKVVWFRLMFPSVSPRQGITSNDDGLRDRREKRYRRHSIVILEGQKKYKGTLSMAEKESHITDSAKMCAQISGLGKVRCPSVDCAKGLVTYCFV